jgi:predicted HTH domain antitoxin
MINILVLHLPDELLNNLQLTEAEMLLELAVALYASGKLSFGKARDLSGLDWVRFRRLLAERDLSAHYNQEDFEADLSAVESLSSAL